MTGMRTRWALTAGLLLEAGLPVLAQAPTRRADMLPPPAQVTPAPVARPADAGTLGVMYEGEPPRAPLPEACSCGPASPLPSACLRRPGIVPLGQSVYAFGRAHVTARESAGMALYQYDFIEGTAALNPRGRFRLARIAALLPRNFCSIVIEPCAPALDEARRISVLTELAAGPFPVAPERIVTAPLPADGLRGVEAALIERNLLSQTQAGPHSAGGVGGVSSVGGATGQTQGAGTTAPPSSPGQ